MAKQSLFAACKRLFRDQLSGTYEVGNNNIFLELYTQQDITDGTTIGDSSEENIVVVAGDTITIPEGYTLTPVQPKKSLVVICNTFVNNGTVSMYQKAPNVLPHDLCIITKQDAYDKDIIIPAYANNQLERFHISSQYDSRIMNGQNGNNGTNRQCGSGGGSANVYTLAVDNCDYAASGSGYAFGGGAGAGGTFGYYSSSASDVDSIYPMRGGAGASYNTWTYNCGGVGNPTGTTGGSNTGAYKNNFGCGGRIIIFCVSFTNNGNINVNGTDSKKPSSISGRESLGGASGAGAVDLFYTALMTEGTITANGGGNYSTSYEGKSSYPGKGGNGSITLTPWAKTSVLKPIEKYMSKENMVYFLTNYIQRLKQGED